MYYSAYSYTSAQIQDPYGQTLTIARAGGLITSISEPAGRSLKFYYKSFNGGTVIDYVEERPNAVTIGRTVRYNYVAFNGTTALDNVLCFDEASLTAHYTYQTSNAGGTNPPLILTCDDSMYGGPMSKIAYEFVPGGAHGFLKAEKQLSGTPVSTLAVTGTNTRQETRGDGKTRTFTYAGGLLKSWTDFRPEHFSSAQNHLNGFVTSSTDARTNVTTLQRNALTGNVEKITHPTTPSETDHLPAGEPAPPSQPFATRAYLAPNCSVETGDPNNCDANNPYYLYSATDERGFTTIYLRDASKRVQQIKYPDGSAEAFLYNDFGQVKGHKRKNGFYEHFEYDTRGLLIRAWNPVASDSLPTSGPRTTITYYALGDPWQDRVQSVTDSRNKVTTYEYETNSAGDHLKGRGQVTKVTYPGGKYRTFTYDRMGRVLRQENELRQPMEYVYDDYGRVTEMKTARPLASNPTVQDGWNTVLYDYVPAPGGSSYARTANAPTTVTSATGVTTSIVYDENLRVISSIQVDSVNSANSATTESHYDAAGNMDWVKDPNTNQTTFDYDQRNRRKKATSPQTDVSGVSGKVSLVSEWFYDPVGNMRLAIQPDGNEQTTTRDALGRVLISKDPMGRPTTYTYTPSGMLQSVKDAKNQLTQFEYNDGRDLRTKMIYPNSTELTGWVYDDNGNVTTRPTIGGPKQFFSYDDRNLLQAMRWDNALDWSDFSYDNAGRLAYARNPNATITRQYDVAGRMILDQQQFPAVQNTLTPLPPELAPQSVVSRRTHGNSGTFDIALPLSGTPGVECRSGSDLTIVLTFPVPVSVANVKVSSGTGRMTTPNPPMGTTMTINLIEVSNAQRLTITLTGLSDGVRSGDLVVPIHMLMGDVNNNGVVTSSDKTQVQANAGTTLTASNFRCDVNCSGGINSSDIAMVSAAISGAALPPAPLPSETANVSYAYDNDGKVKRLYVADTNGSATNYDFSFGYDALGRFSTISQGLNSGTSYQYFYDKASNVLERRNNLSVTSQFTVPNELNRVKDRVVQARRLVNGQLELYNFSHELYGFDKMSRMVTLNHLDSYEQDTFGYNPAGELIWNYEEHDWRSMIYTLDNAGNRTQLNNNGTIVPFTPNNLNQYEQTGNGPQHEITGYQDVIYGHLNDGPLVWASSMSQGLYRVGYDALGRCVRRTTNGQVTYYVYDGARMIVELSPAQANLQSAIVGNALYGLGVDELIARYNNGTGQWFTQDRLGSVSAVLDVEGKVTEQYRYDAFGAPTIKNPTGTVLNQTGINNRFLFTGREWVGNYGFYEYRARAYNPKLGRFMSEDPLGFAAGDTNLFSYCGGDPVNLSDPMGETPVYNPGGNFFTYWINPGPQRLPGGYMSPSSQQCGAGCQFLSGAPNTRYWFQGASVGSTTPVGTVIATGWQSGRYPSLSPANYHATYGTDATVNHVAFYLGPAPGGNIFVLQQWAGHPASIDVISPRGFNEVRVGATNEVRHGGSGGGGSGGGDGGAFMFTVPSVSAGIGGAIAALNAYGQAHGPGIGVVTVTNAQGTHLVSAGNVGGSFSYGGTTYVGGVAAWGLGTNLVSTGGGGIGGWQTVTFFWGGGGQPGEGSHPVPFELN